MTSRWARSPRGKVFGVCTGLAEWRDLNPEPVRWIVFFAILFTGVFPGILIYLALALILPAQEPGEYRAGSRSSKYSHIYRDAEDASYSSESSKSNEDLKNEYEELKRKVEAMEDEMFDKERDWDERFNSGK